MKAQCKVCGVFKDRDLVLGASRDGKTVRRFFKDSEGYLWNGRTCRNCHRDSVRAGKKKPSANNRVIRYCRKCSKKLPASRYFHHVTCMYNVSDAYGKWEYGGRCS